MTALGRARRTCLLLLGVVGCSRDPNPSAGRGEAGCSSACQAVAATACPGAATPEQREASCRTGCAEALALSRASGCVGEHATFLACVSAGSLGCLPEGMSAAAILEHGFGLTSCKAEHERYRSCTAPCRDEGVIRVATTRLTHQGRNVEVAAELVGAGCALPAEPARHSVPGAPCSHHSVCTAVRCNCAERASPYFARACVDARCAGPAEACSLAPRAVGRPLCTRDD